MKPQKDKAFATAARQYGVISRQQCAAAGLGPTEIDSMLRTGQLSRHSPGGRFIDLLKRAGARPMRRQANVGSDSQWLGRVDFVDDELPLSVQIDGTRFHQALIDRRLDDAQTAALVAAGYEVLRLAERDVWHDGPRSLQRLAAARNRAAQKKKT
ncbi:MAG: type IV toxin-antitoxin system AbiEi family antitoxin domain-containing protein [Acidimicrobiales bacterium]|nr:type IV toxin-antitoxin system AbiEi family antitoxin domain-containing protein [Acidimicrobiales bacterium]